MTGPKVSCAAKLWSRQFRRASEEAPALRSHRSRWSLAPVDWTPPQYGLTRDLPTEDRSKEAGRPGLPILSHRSRHRVQVRKAEFEPNAVFRDAEKRLPIMSIVSSEPIGIEPVTRMRSTWPLGSHGQSGHLANDSPVHRENSGTDGE